MKFSWIVMNYNCNTNKIESYDVLKYRQSFVKRTKKASADINEFGRALSTEMMWQYWSRAEYELVLEKCNDELWLKPWVGCRNPEEVKIDVSNDPFWQEFSKWDNVRWWDDEAKIDIYDQLIFKWDEFINFCWTYRLPYERRRADIQYVN